MVGSGAFCRSRLETSEAGSERSFVKRRVDDASGRREIATRLKCGNSMTRRGCAWGSPSRKFIKLFLQFFPRWHIFGWLAVVREHIDTAFRRHSTHRESV